MGWQTKFLANTIKVFSSRYWHLKTECGFSVMNDYSVRSMKGIFP